MTICVQSSAIPQKLQKASKENVKSKRSLNFYDGTILGPPPPQHVNSLAYVPSSTSSRSVLGSGKYTNVFGFDDISYSNLFNKLNGIDYGLPTHISPPPFESPSIFSNGYGYINYGASNHFNTAYVAHDGRILKQYAVHERIHNDLPDPINDYQPKQAVFTQTGPSQLPPNFVPNLAQPRNLNVDGNINNNIPTFLNKNHGPVAFGSGKIFLKKFKSLIYEIITFIRRIGSC